MKKYKIECFTNRDFQHYVERDSLREAITYAADWISGFSNNQFVITRDGETCLCDVWSDEQKGEL